MNALWAAALTGAKTLREIEELTERWGRRISDTTLHALLCRLQPDAFRTLLVQMVRRAWRAKQLQSDLPFVLIAVDGKVTWSGGYEANDLCQRQTNAKAPRYIIKELRAATVGGPTKLVVGRHPIAADSSEMNSVPDFVDMLVEDYGGLGMLDVLSFDAGMISKANADKLHEAGLRYIMALKNPQKDLADAAVAELGSRQEPDAQTPWQRANGARVRRTLFRSEALAGWRQWRHLKEVWLVRKEIERHGERTVEERYFVTSVPPDETPGTVPLEAVRAHWGIENNVYWTLDTAWEEDTRPWTNSATEVVSLLRLLAFNTVMLLRTRALRSKANRERPWRQLLRWIGEVLRVERQNATRLFDTQGAQALL